MLTNSVRPIRAFGDEEQLCVADSFGWSDDSMFGSKTKIVIRPQGDANLYALIGERKTMFGEVKVNGIFGQERQVELAAYAANLVDSCFPVAPDGAKWEALDEEDANRLTLVSYTGNRPVWLLVLTAMLPVTIPLVGVERLA